MTVAEVKAEEAAIIAAALEWHEARGALLAAQASNYVERFKEWQRAANALGAAVETYVGE